MNCFHIVSLALLGLLQEITVTSVSCFLLSVVVIMQKCNVMIH